MWLFLAASALASIAIPLLLRSLRLHYGALFAELGQPRVLQLFSHDPSHWKIQFRFLWFVLSGRVITSTAGTSRVLASLTWLAYAGMLSGLTWFIYLAATNALH